MPEVARGLPPTTTVVLEQRLAAVSRRVRIARGLEAGARVALVLTLPGLAVALARVVVPGSPMGPYAVSELALIVAGPAALSFVVGSLLFALRRPLSRAEAAAWIEARTAVGVPFTTALELDPAHVFGPLVRLEAERAAASVVPAAVAPVTFPGALGRAVALVAVGLALLVLPPREASAPVREEAAVALVPQAQDALGRAGTRVRLATSSLPAGPARRRIEEAGVRLQELAAQIESGKVGQREALDRLAAASEAVRLEREAAQGRRAARHALERTGALDPLAAAASGHGAPDEHAVRALANALTGDPRARDAARTALRDAREALTQDPNAAAALERAEHALDTARPGESPPADLAPALDAAARALAATPGPERDQQASADLARAATELDHAREALTGTAGEPKPGLAGRESVASPSPTQVAVADTKPRGAGKTPGGPAAGDATPDPRLSQTPPQVVADPSGGRRSPEPMSSQTPSDGVAKSPESVAKSPESVAKSPESVAKSPESVAKSPESVANAPDRVAKSPESVAKSPESVAKSPESVANAPDRVAKSPESVAKSPESVANAPDRATNAPDRATNAPDRATNAPDRATNAPDRATNAPDRATNAPDRATNAPDRVANAPDRVANAPDRATNAPDRATNAPDRATNAPDRATNAPDRATNAPDRATNAPDRATNAPDRAANAPDRVANAPESVAKSPDNTGKTPDETASPPEGAKPDSHAPEPGASPASEGKLPVEAAAELAKMVPADLLAQALKLGAKLKDLLPTPDAGAPPPVSPADAEKLLERLPPETLRKLAKAMGEIAKDLPPPPAGKGQQPSPIDPATAERLAKKLPPDVLESLAQAAREADKGHASGKTTEGGAGPGKPGAGGAGSREGGPGAPAGARPLGTGKPGEEDGEDPGPGEDASPTGKATANGKASGPKGPGGFAGRDTSGASGNAPSPGTKPSAGSSSEPGTGTKPGTGTGTTPGNPEAGRGVSGQGPPATVTDDGAAAATSGRPGVPWGTAPERLPTSERDALRSALEQKRVPPSYERAVREYFDLQNK